MLCKNGQLLLQVFNLADQLFILLLDHPVLFRKDTEALAEICVQDEQHFPGKLIQFVR